MKIDLYVDGSFTGGNTAYGGILILNSKGEAEYVQRVCTLKPFLVSMRNVGGELAAAMIGLGLASSLLESVSKDSNVTGTIHIYFDYVGIEKFATKEWKAKKEGSLFYCSVLKGLKNKYPNINYVFHKVKAHSGNKWNEVVDKIAYGEKSNIKSISETIICL